MKLDLDSLAHGPAWRDGVLALQDIAVSERVSAAQRTACSLLLARLQEVTDILWTELIWEMPGRPIGPEDTYNAVSGLLHEHRRRKSEGKVHARAFRDITAERKAQRATWGDQSHEAPVWMTILGEEYGELCQAILRARTHHTDEGRRTGAAGRSLSAVRTEAVQVAAVAVAIIEAIDDGRADVGAYVEGDIPGEARP